MTTKGLSTLPLGHYVLHSKCFKGKSKGCFPLPSGTKEMNKAPIGSLSLFSFSRLIYGGNGTLPIVSKISSFNSMFDSTSIYCPTFFIIVKLILGSFSDTNF